MGLMGEVAKATVSAGGKVIGVTTSGLSAKGRSVVPRHTRAANRKPFET